MATIDYQQISNQLENAKQQALAIQSQLNAMAAASPTTSSVGYNTSTASVGSPTAGSNVGYSTGTGSSQTANQVYTIKPGDTLSKIASQYGTTVSALVASNPQITNPDLIYAGSTLKIPGGTTSGTGAVSLYSSPIDTQTAMKQLEDIKQKALGIQSELDKMATQGKTETTTQTPNQSDIEWMNNLYNQLNTLKSSTGLTPDQEKLYTDLKNQIETQYTQALADLRKQQETARQRLLGRYAAMGFSEPGIIEGETTSMPGIATKGLREFETEAQKQLTNLTGQKASDLLAIEQARQNLLAQQARQAEQDLQNRLALMANLYQTFGPQVISSGGLSYTYNPQTGETNIITPPEIQAMLSTTSPKESYSTPQVDENGNVFVVDYSQNPPKVINAGKVAPNMAPYLKVINDVLGTPTAVVNTLTNEVIPLNKSVLDNTNKESLDELLKSLEGVGSPTTSSNEGILSQLRKKLGL